MLPGNAYYRHRSGMMPVGHSGVYRPPGQAEVVGYYDQAGQFRCGPMAPQSPAALAAQYGSPTMSGIELTPTAVQAAAALSKAAQQVAADNIKDYFGVDSGAAALIGAGATVNVVSQPQKNIIAERFWLSAATAASFVIVDIRAGVEPILITTDPVPGAMFEKDSNAPYFKAVPITVGMTFTIQVQNVGAAAARFITSVSGKPFRAAI